MQLLYKRILQFVCYLVRTICNKRDFQLGARQPSTPRVRRILEEDERWAYFYEGAKMLRQYIRKYRTYLESQTPRHRQCSPLPHPSSLHPLPHYHHGLHRRLTDDRWADGMRGTKYLVRFIGRGQHTINKSHLPSQAILTCSPNTTKIAKPGQITKTQSQPYIYHIFLTLTSYVHFLISSSLFPYI